MVSEARILRKEYNNLRSHATAAGRLCSLTYEEFLRIRRDVCPVLGHTFKRGKLTDNSRSYDRIDNDKHYFFDNVQCVSYKYNKAKGNLTPLEQVKVGVHFLLSNWDIFKEYVSTKAAAVVHPVVVA